MRADTEERASFTALSNASEADFAILRRHLPLHKNGLADRILAHLNLLDGDYGGFPVDRLQHSLQTATRAHRDGRGEAYVVMALLHDIGDTIGSYNHPEIAAAMLRPFVGADLYWIALRHGIFQGYYYFGQIGLDPDMREAFRGHPHFEACAEFCALYDETAFDAAYDSAPLSFFEPMVRRLFARPVNPTFLIDTAI